MARRPALAGKRRQSPSLTFGHQHFFRLFDQSLAVQVTAEAQELSERAGVCLPRTPLWASAGTKNPGNGEVLYVEPLIGAESIKSLPDATLAAFRQHGRYLIVCKKVDQARDHIQAFLAQGIDLDVLGESLQSERGVDCRCLSQDRAGHADRLFSAGQGGSP